MKYIKHLIKPYLAFTLVSIYILYGFSPDLKSQAISLSDTALKSVLLQQCDKDKNGELEIQEAMECKRLLISGLYFTNNIIVLENFVNLERLQLNGTGVEVIDLSNNKKLKYLDISHNNLTNVIVSKASIIDSFNCSSNSLDYIPLIDMPNLRYLKCDNNNIERLDFRFSSGITFLSCSNNLLKSIDISYLLLLENLLIENNELNRLNVGINSKLKRIQARNNKISSIDLRNNPELEYLNILFNEVKELNLENNAKLKELNCAYNDIVILELKQNVKLTQLISSYNRRLNTVDLRNGSNKLLYGPESVVLWQNPNLLCVSIDDTTSNFILKHWKDYSDSLTVFSMDCSATSIKKEKIDQNAYLYPNPLLTPGLIQFGLNNSEYPKNISMYNVLGQMIETECSFEVSDNQKCTVTVPNLEKGLFLLKVIYSSSYQDVKFIVQ